MIAEAVQSDLNTVKVSWPVLPKQAWGHHYIDTDAVVIVATEQGIHAESYSGGDVDVDIVDDPAWDMRGVDGFAGGATPPNPITGFLQGPVTPPHSSLTSP